MSACKYVHKKHAFIIVWYPLSFACIMLNITCTDLLERRVHLVARRFSDCGLLHKSREEILASGERL